MNDLIENIKTKGMQKFIALGALIILYIAFSVFGNPQKPHKTGKVAVCVGF